MYFVDNESAVSVMPTPAAAKYTDPHWFTSGDANTRPTYPGPDWFNIMQAEQLNVLSAAGLTPKKDDSTQLTQAIKALLGKPDAGWVQSVNNVKPDAAGNVVISIPVSSVNGKTGAVQLSAKDVGAVASVNGSGPDANGNVQISIPAQAVSSVNGKTGAVQLSAKDVGAVASVNGAGPDANGNVQISIPSQAVSSVNGKTGAVVLNAADVGVTMDNVGTNQFALSTNGTARVVGVGGIAGNSNDVTVTLGRTFPSAIIAIGGSFAGNGGQDSDSWWSATIVNAGSFNLHIRNSSGNWSFVVLGH